MNNAAANPYAGPLIDVDLPRFDKTVQVNVRGALVWTQLAWRLWMREHGGVVINISKGRLHGPLRGRVYAPCREVDCWLGRAGCYVGMTVAAVGTLGLVLLVTMVASALEEDCSSEQGGCGL